MSGNRELMKKAEIENGKTTYECQECGVEFQRYNTTIRSRAKESTAYGDRGVFCSRHCFAMHGWTVTHCKYCGKGKAIKRSKFKGDGKHYCSPECQKADRKEQYVTRLTPLQEEIVSLCKRMGAMNTRDVADCMVCAIAQARHQLVQIAKKRGLDHYLPSLKLTEILSKEERDNGRVV